MLIIIYFTEALEFVANSFNLSIDVLICKSTKAYLTSRSNR